MRYFNFCAAHGLEPLSGAPHYGFESKRFDNLRQWHVYLRYVFTTAFGCPNIKALVVWGANMNSAAHVGDREIDGRAAKAS